MEGTDKGPDVDSPPVSECHPLVLPRNKELSLLDIPHPSE